MKVYFVCTYKQKYFCAIDVSKNRNLQKLTIKF